MRALTVPLLLALATPVQADPATEPATEPSRVTVTETTIEIFEPVTFAPGSATITPGSYRTLNAYAAALQGNPDILVVEIEGHRDFTESAPVALQRARAVMRYLSSRGVFPLRMRARAAAAARPPHGHNRRIELLIVQRAA